MKLLENQVEERPLSNPFWKTLFPQFSVLHHSSNDSRYLIKCEGDTTMPSGNFRPQRFRDVLCLFFGFNFETLHFPYTDSINSFPYTPDVEHLGGKYRCKTPNLTLVSRERLESNLLDLSARHA